MSSEEQAAAGAGCATSSIMMNHPKPPNPIPDEVLPTSFIVLGASGDLAKKKTFPSLFSLFRQKMMPTVIQVVGYARSKMDHDGLVKAVSPGLAKNASERKKRAFLDLCQYVAGGYDNDEDWIKLDKYLREKEDKAGGPTARIYYMAIPPSVFHEAARMMKKHGMARDGGYTRIVMEKPFGMDTDSARELLGNMGKLFSDDQIYRIDHYLGKEMVQNIPVLRFANSMFEPLWNNKYISCIKITFKEMLSTQGRGGYFDQFGIIRDVVQNHLFQALALLAMEPPADTKANSFRKAKADVLRAMEPLTLENTVLGQYGPDAAGKEKGYLDDETVKPGSNTATFVATVVHINNERWKGVPFMIKAGKALSDKRVEIRVQFKKSPYGLYKNTTQNELIFKLSPGERLAGKLLVKQPGLLGNVAAAYLDLPFENVPRPPVFTCKPPYACGGDNDPTELEFENSHEPDAYERLIFDALKGDQSLFVAEDEIIEAWKAVTPLLQRIDSEKIKPKIYPFGSRGPPEADALFEKHGFVYDPEPPSEIPEPQPSPMMPSSEEGGHE